MVNGMEILPFAIFGLGTPELIIIAVVLILLFGARRIPDLGKSVGQGIRNFKKGLSDSEEEEETDEDAKRIEAEDAAVIDQETSAKKAKSTT